MLIHAATDNDIHPPLFGATQRTFGLCRGLARRHQVSVLCVVPNRSRGAAEEMVDGVRLVRRKAWYTSAAWRLERLGLAPVFAAASLHAARARTLAGALPGRPDVVAADLNLAALLERDDALRVHTSHNVEADHFRDAGPAMRGRKAWVARRRRMEAEAVARADLTVVCADEDAARMRELYDLAADRLVVIPNGYDETRVRPAGEEARRAARVSLGIADDAYVALFLGSDVPHNRAALGLLVAEVLPPLAADGFRLVVAGSVTRALSAPHPAWLSCHAETPDLAPLLAAADAGLNPVTAGGGSNVKVPTYLAAGLAVVTTPYGLRGYPDLAPWVVVAAPRETTAALRERPRGWRARGTAAPAAVKEYAWGVLGERLGGRLEERVHGRAARSAEGGA